VSFDGLRLFRDVARFRSVSKGAEINEITPSAASQQINELERSLGVTLFDRSTRPLSLTREGKLYDDMCRDVLSRYEQFRAGLGELKATVEGSVRVAAIYSVGLSEMSRLEEEFSTRAPDASLEVTYLRPEKVYDAVAADHADLGLVSYPEPTREIAVIPWRKEEMVLAAAPPHPLAELKELDARALQGVEFIAFDEDLPIAREVDAYFEAHGVEVNKIMRFDNIQTIKEAVMLGSGVSILPARIMQSELAQGRLAAVPLAAPGLHRPLGIVHRKKKRFTRAAQIFLELLQESPAQMTIQGGETLERLAAALR
jgi:DNA-binding transcriptional LysR family regulator